MFLVLILLSSLLLFANAECPAPSVVEPCICKDNSISCRLSNVKDYKIFFKKISDSVKNKNFKNFFSTHGNFQQLPSNMFGDIKFQRVEFWNSDLSNIKIVRNALKSLNGILNSIWFTDCNLTEEGMLDIIKAAKSLTSAKTFWLFSNKMTKLPSNLFDDAESRDLSLNSLVLQENQITKVETRAVFGLNKLHILNLGDNPIKEIEKFAFATEESKNDLLIYFFGRFGALSSAFGPLSLAGIRRPAYLFMGGPNFKTLNEPAFTLYFEQHSQHFIYWEHGYGNLTCDCDALWLWNKKEQYRDRFRDKYTGKESVVSCDNHQNRPLWDLKKEDFGNCDYMLKYQF